MHYGSNDFVLAFAGDPGFDGEPAVGFDREFGLAEINERQGHLTPVEIEIHFEATARQLFDLKGAE